MFERLAFWRRAVEHRIGSFTIQLPRDHPLGLYQRSFRTYDRFLPYIAEALPQGTVIDVGANVGDSIAAMATRAGGHRYIAVEPSLEFQPWLKRNIDGMTSVSPGLRIDNCACFISNNLPIAGQTIANGTGHVVLDPEGGAAAAGPDNVRLDDLVTSLAVDNLVLLKSDTDGFDWTVLDSGLGTLAQQGPALFFECDVGQSSDHYRAYGETLASLAELGYRFHLFDNFGGFLCSSADVGQVMAILRYVMLQNSGNFARTFHYVDILASTPKYAHQVSMALDAFAADFS